MSKEELKEKIKEIKQKVELEQIVTENIVPFKIKEKNYRLRMPTTEERVELEQKRGVQLFKLLENPENKTRKDWIKLYKEKRNIDIQEMEYRINDKAKLIQSLQKDLTEATDDNAKDRFENQIADKVEEQLKDLKEIDELLEHCIEKQLEEYSNSYSIYLVLEEKIEDTWNQVFTAFDELLKSDDLLLIAIAKNSLSYLVQGLNLNEK